MIEKPIPESYWVLPGRFLAGEYPGLGHDQVETQRRLIAFIRTRFDTFIDLTSENERPPYASLLSKEGQLAGRIVRHRRFSFPDFSVPSREKMVAALDAIDGELAEGRKVYLHCVGGIGRTGTTVGCYLVRHGVKPADALLQVRDLYRTSLQSLFVPESPETGEQARFILNWDENGLA
jgi:hypothetical protein